MILEEIRGTIIRCSTVQCSAVQYSRTTLYTVEALGQMKPGGESWFLVALL
jgi:hypothetical protein